MNFSKKPLKIGAGMHFSGVESGSELKLIFTMSDNTIKIKNIKKNDRGYVSTDGGTVAVGDEGVILGDKIFAVDGFENMQQINLAK